MLLLSIMTRLMCVITDISLTLAASWYYLAGCMMVGCVHMWCAVLSIHCVVVSGVPTRELMWIDSKPESVFFIVCC